MKLNFFYAALFFICFNIGCKSPEAKELKETESISTELPSWAKDAVIYEVNVRQYTEEGTFDAFSNHLQRISDMGVDILWFMPIHPISETKRKGGLGSYYAVSDYTAVNPEYGDMASFDRMVEKIHSLGMHIIIDWVPNHTGWDHPWIKANPSWYTQDSAGNVIDPIDESTGKSWGWTDVADLNYSNQDMRKAMIDDMLFWLKEKQVDGFRQDVAHGVPDDFWHQVRDSVFSIGRPIYMLAEAEMEDHRNSSSFHASYAWELHHVLNGVAKGEKNVKDITAWFEKDRKTFDKGHGMLFTSNHDENTWSGTVFDRMGDAHKILAAFTFAFDGVPLIYSGQEEPLKKRLKFFEKDNINFKNFEYQDFYTKLCNLKSDNEALWNGSFGGAPEMLFHSEEVLVFKRVKNKNTVYGIFNLSDQASSYTLENQIDGKDLFSNETMTLKGNESLTLKPWEYFILTHNG